MTTEHTTWLAEEDDGTVTAHCTDCNWQGTERVSNRDQAGQEAELHTATKAGRTCDCAGTDANVPDDQRGNAFAVCPACGLTVEVIHQGRYAPHNMIVDGLAGWEETLRAAQEGGMLAVRRINERARIQAMSAEYRQQKRSAS